MTYCKTTSTEAHTAEVETLRKVLQQATDQYPRLAAFLLMLPNVTPDTVRYFHEVVSQQVSGLAATRRLSGRPVPPTVLRWIWASPPGQTCRHLLLMNQDTLCHPRYDVPPDRCFDTMYDYRINGITPLVEVYQQWLNDQTRLAVRYGFSTRKTHTRHTLTTSGITLADGQRVSMVVPSCLLLVSPVVRQAWNESVVSGLVDMNSLRTYLPFCGSGWVTNKNGVTIISGGRWQH